MDHNNGIIRLLRGDSYCQPILINIGDKLNPTYYKLTERDTLYFGLMDPNQSFEDAVLKKRFDHTSDTDNNGNILLKLRPEDTLNIAVGKYYYMIKLQTIDAFGNSLVKTIVAPTQFWLEGNNVEPKGKERYEVGIYDIDHIILEGGQVTEDGIIFEGGEII